MKVIPYQSVNAIEFLATKSSVLSRLGQPAKQGLSRTGNIELNYKQITFRFSQKTLEFIEATANAPVIFLENVAVEFEVLQRFLEAHDPTSFSVVGFYVSPRFGIAFDPNQPSFVTAFPESELFSWRNISA